MEMHVFVIMGCALMGDLESGWRAEHLYLEN